MKKNIDVIICTNKKLIVLKTNKTNFLLIKEILINVIIIHQSNLLICFLIF